MFNTLTSDDIRAYAPSNRFIPGSGPEPAWLMRAASQQQALKEIQAERRLARAIARFDPELKLVRRLLATELRA
jgi:hypothetical protein